MKKMIILAAVIAVTTLTAISYPASGKMNNAGAKSAAATSCTNGFAADPLLACPGGCTNKVNAALADCGKGCTNKVSAVLAKCGKGCTNKFSINLAVGTLSCTNNVNSVKI
ncbi:MAG: hypothetical protein PHY43_01845 [Verrucomicrobiales bacterium]|nr:hypothetical protein [Verrucomicrobiales bacterium]